MAELAQSNPTVRPADRRKLIAVVGYSRLIGLDDAGTLARLKALRANLIASIKERGGILVQAGRDSLLVTFEIVLAGELSLHRPGHAFSAELPSVRLVREALALYRTLSRELGSRTGLVVTHA
jgi:hypothetical protein